ncbi:MAG: hypothetical protein NVS3B26_27560 [Mycobacteriales bacterium]
MTDAGDDPGEMDMTEPGHDDSDLDAAFEAFLAGVPASAALRRSAVVLTALRSLADQPGPVPSPALAAHLGARHPAALAEAVAGDVIDLAGRRRRKVQRVTVTALSATMLALSSVGVAAAHGTLPNHVQDAVADAVTALTPFSVPHAAPRHPAKQTRPTKPAPSPTALQPHSRDNNGADTRPSGQDTGEHGPGRPHSNPTHEDGNKSPNGNDTDTSAGNNTSADNSTGTSPGTGTGGSDGPSTLPAPGTFGPSGGNQSAGPAVGATGTASQAQPAGQPNQPVSSSNS